MNVPSVIYSQDVLIQSTETDTTNIGWLKLRSNSPIQKLWVDSLEMPIIPNQILKLQTGIHILRMRKEGSSGKWYSRDMIDTVYVKPQDTVTVHIEFPTYEILYSDPYGAEVWRGEKLLGVTPLRINRDQLFQKKFTLKMDGYQDTTIYNPVRINLPLQISLKVDSSEQKRKRMFFQQKIGERKKNRNLALLTFGLTVAFGSAAYFLKKEANHHYDLYRKAGNPEDIRHYYELTKRYDRFAAGSYIIFEVNLITSAYFFFSYLLDRN